MTEATHPIMPPQELVEKWANLPDDWNTVVSIIAEWGADQELEACCAELDKVNGGYWSAQLRAARRPKPLSLKEQALESVKRFESSGEFFSDQMRELEFIRKALEQLDD